MSAAALTLASTSPQRRAILEQLAIPFRVVEPDYVEYDPPGARPEALVRDHAVGKARSVHGDDGWTLGVDTAVFLDGAVYGKPADAAHARSMLSTLHARTHVVRSGLCLLGPGVEEVVDVATRVTFRRFDEHELNAYLATGEWSGRAGGYAIQATGARLVERIDGDYLNVVGLPAAALLDLLERHVPTLLDA